MAVKVPTYDTTLVDGELKLGPVKMIEPARCPHSIFMPSHYRDDGSCKCDDPSETVMRSWGYKWSKKLLCWK